MTDIKLYEGAYCWWWSSDLSEALWAAMCEAAPSPWRPIEEAPKFRPLLGFASGVTFSMMWKSDNVELNKAIKKFLKHTPPLEPSGAGWCAYAYGQYCRKADGEFFFVNPTHFIPLSALGMPGGEDE